MMASSAAHQRSLSRPKKAVITDDELGMVADTLHEPRAVVAEMLGRSAQMVGVMRRIVRNGDDRQFPGAWSEDDDDKIRSIGEQRRFPYAKLIEMFPGRTISAINYRRQYLGSRSARLGIGLRTVLAKTCPKCGLLRSGEWFGVNKGVCAAHCRTCSSDSARHYADTEMRDSRAAAYRASAQAITAANATRSGQEYTDSDIRVLEDRTLTDFQKALALKRSYAAASTARRSMGFLSSAARLSELQTGTWFVNVPAAVKDGA